VPDVSFLTIFFLTTLICNNFDRIYIQIIKSILLILRSSSLICLVPSFCFSSQFIEYKINSYFLGFKKACLLHLDTKQY
jgi:hypothetical protein